MVAVHAKEKKKKRKKKSSPSTPSSDSIQRSTSRSSSVSPAPPLLQNEPCIQEDETMLQEYHSEPHSQENEGRSLFDELQEVGVKPQDSISTSSSRVSLNSNTEESGNQMFVTLDNYGIPAMSETEAAANATACVLSAMSSQQPTELGMSMGFTAGSSNGMAVQEMKESLLSMAKSKDEVDERNRYVVFLHILCMDSLFPHKLAH